MLQTFSLPMFTEQVNSRFRLVLNAEQSLDLELVQVTDLGSSAHQQRFSLFFLGPADVYLPQQIYHLEHDALGSMDLFLVPVGREGKAYQFEAVFNLLAETP